MFSRRELHVQERKRGKFVTTSKRYNPSEPQPPIQVLGHWVGENEENTEMSSLKRKEDRLPVLSKEVPPGTLDVGVQGTVPSVTNRTTDEWKKRNKGTII